MRTWLRQLPSVLPDTRLNVREMIHHQHLAGLQFHHLIAHALAQRAVQGNQQFQPLMSGQALGERPRAKVKQADHKRKTLRQFQFMPPLRVQLVRGAMGPELQPVRDGQQVLPRQAALQFPHMRR